VNLAGDLREEHGIEVMADRLDVRDRQAVDTWFGGLTGDWGKIDILVNNAGLARGLAPLHQGDVEHWEQMIDTNVKGLLYVTRVVLPGMVERKTGHVINIGSIAGHETYAGGSVYCATKHAVTGINRALGIDETEFAMVRFDGDRERSASVYRGLQPLTGEDVADAVLFCATRPQRANVREMVLLAGSQAGAVHVHRDS